MKLIGIDPGIRGGLAGLDTDERSLWAIPTPTVMVNEKAEYDIRQIAHLLRQIEPDMVCLERVHSMPGQGVASTFLFGKGFGILLGIVGTLGYPLVMVTPRVWKAKYEITADKETSRVKATQLYPDCARFWKLKKHDGLAESAILAHYIYNGPSLDAISARDISNLYLIGDTQIERPSTHPRRNHTRAKDPKNHRARDGSHKRRNNSTGRGSDE